MKNWNIWVGAALIILGIAAAVYFGLWWAFIGGIILFIEGVKAEPLNSTWIAFGIARVMFAGLVGYVSGALLIVPGFAFIAAEDIGLKSKKKKHW